MKLNLLSISISLAAMATARHNEVTMRPHGAPDHICAYDACNNDDPDMAFGTHPYSIF